ncbi:TetR/AcrR family transcriptional regulator [Hoyosella rhizosphaerae]|uniref:TetR/AcrR family transcriptional regulator n=1 Tax=Hoyosella rhizosphaerae TaxID=1755582 RepID=UPI00166E5185|nr:helix-turn-helix domain-containing protein [Hoyosella rhizosphaerae]MBN4927707.1 TetR/AcrR family transcriptional regulator [Hoyosella rhizosphaerae]
MTNNQTLGRRGAKRGAVAKLSRDEIVLAARQLIEAEGAESLSMRRLATIVNSSPMALYHHVDGRADLLSAVLQQLCAEMPRPVLSDDPRTRMVESATILHSILSQYPWSLEILGSSAALGWDALNLVEEFLCAARNLELTAAQADQVFVAVWNFIAGSVMMRVNNATVQAAEGTSWLAVGSDEGKPECPLARQLGEQWPGVVDAYSPVGHLDTIISSLVEEARAERGLGTMRVAG